MTREQLQAQNIALRDLLAAIAEAADVPYPANPEEEGMYAVALRHRADVIAVYADMKDKTGEQWETETYHIRAQSVREQAARPLYYTPEAAE